MIVRRVKRQLNAYYDKWKETAHSGDYREAAEWAGFICIGLAYGFEPKWTTRDRMEFIAWVELKLPGGIDNTLATLDHLLQGSTTSMINPTLKSTGNWVPSIN